MISTLTTCSEERRLETVMRGEFGVQCTLKSHLMVTCSKAGIAGVSCLQRWCGRFPYRPPCAKSLPEKITSVKCALMHPKFALAVEQPNWLRAVHHKVGPRGLEMIGRLASKYEKRADNTQHSLMEEAGCWATTAEDLVSICAAMARVQEWLFLMSFQLKDCAIYIKLEYSQIH